VLLCHLLIGMIQEGKAEKAAEAVKAMLSASGAVRTVACRDLHNVKCSFC
jgi:hypothetical protein